jgi:hypothetical protein
MLFESHDDPQFTAADVVTAANMLAKDGMTPPTMFSISVAHVADRLLVARKNRLEAPFLDPTVPTWQRALRVTSAIVFSVDGVIVLLLVCAFIALFQAAMLAARFESSIVLPRDHWECGRMEYVAGGGDFTAHIDGKTIHHARGICLEYIRR